MKNNETVYEMNRRLLKEIGTAKTACTHCGKPLIKKDGNNYARSCKWHTSNITHEKLRLRDLEEVTFHKSQMTQGNYLYNNDSKVITKAKRELVNEIVEAYNGKLYPLHQINICYQNEKGTFSTCCNEEGYAWSDDFETSEEANKYIMGDL